MQPEQQCKQLPAPAERAVPVVMEAQPVWESRRRRIYWRRGRAAGVLYAGGFIGFNNGTVQGFSYATMLVMGTGGSGGSGGAGGNGATGASWKCYQRF